MSIRPIVRAVALATALLSLTTAPATQAQTKRSEADQRAHMQMLDLDCRECHTCDNPTSATACLKACPRLTVAQNTGRHVVAEAPEGMVLDALADQYQGVRFNHKLHAGMSEMNAGCSTCHHFCPPGKIPPCGSCHSVEASTQNLRQPSLKGAYHRQCMNCHREWSHETDCNICHLPSSNFALKGDKTDPTDIMGKSHPVIAAPEKRSYHTPYEKGPVVTFYHQEHIDLFGLRCVDCHQKENCSYCHDMQKPATLKKSMEQVHAICSSCHQTAKCSKCHDTVERPAFSHAATGWSVGRFHSRLECRACHPTGKRISKVNRECTSCHGGWNQENFHHAVTGLQLDETHGAADCADCHANRRYAEKPTCAGCHDDNRDFKSVPPGKYVRVEKR